MAGNAVRPLTDNVFDALREAVVVVDASNVSLPILLANAAAERCFCDGRTQSLTACSLHSLLGAAADSVLTASKEAQAGGQTGVNRVLTWRFPGGDSRLLTEIKMLELSPGHPVLMLTFYGSAAEPAQVPSTLSSVEYLPLDLLILDPELTVTYANAGASRTAGTSTEALANLSALVILPTSAVPREALTRALAGERFHDDSIAVKTPGAPIRWFDVDVQPLMDESSVVGVVVLSMEITERRQQRRPGVGGDKRLFALTEFAPDVISVAARDGQLRYVSGDIMESLGYAPNERLSQSLFDGINPEDVGPLQSRYAELGRGAVGSFAQPVRMRHKDGTYRWLDLVCAAAFENPFLRGVVVSARDITDRKQAEARLREGDEVFKLAAEAVNGVVFDWDLIRGGVRRSRGVHEVLGVELDELESRDGWSDRIHPEDRGTYEQKMMAAVVSGRGWTATYRIRDIRGRYRSILERGLIQRSPNGDPIRAIGCAVDVSDISRLTGLLAEALRIAKMGGWEYNYATHEFEWTEELYRIYETEPASFEVSWRAMMERCTPDAQLRLKQAIIAAEAGDGRMDLELEIITLMDRRIWVRLVGYIEKLEGRPFRAYGSLQNIQARKAAQIALENSTDWLKLSMSMARMNAWRWDRTGDVLEFAVVDGKRVRAPRMVAGMKRMLSRMHPKDRVAVRRGVDEAFNLRREVQREFRVKSRGGRYRVYTAVARPLFDAANQPSGLVGVTKEITERYDAEARLRRSEELLRTTTANTADTLILVDADLRICFINRGLCDVSIEGLVGEDYSALLPESVRSGVVDKLQRVLMTAEPATYEFETNLSGFETSYYENRAVLVREDVIGTGISITVRDITERKRLEHEILEVASRERQAVGRDLHDGLGQELTGVSLLLRGLATRLEAQAPESVPQINEIVKLVNQSIQTAHGLARGLLPVSSEGGGLAGALHSLADRSRDVYGLEVVCRVKVSPKRALSEGTANHLYRIAQEALTNTARHAHASSVDIYLLVTAGKYLLRITDNGIGIGDAHLEGFGMGLKIMKYRASMIGATFEIVSNHPHGTVISVSGQRAPATTALESANAI